MFYSLAFRNGIFGIYYTIYTHTYIYIRRFHHHDAKTRRVRYIWWDNLKLFKYNNKLHLLLPINTRHTYTCLIYNAKSLREGGRCLHACRSVCVCLEGSQTVCMEFRIHIRERGGCSIYAKMTLTHQFNMEQDNLANARRRRYDVVYSTQCMHFALLYSINTDAAPKIHFLPRAFYIYV